jgi:diguanylate cyclase (GGDEF)-like protein
MEMLGFDFQTKPKPTKDMLVGKAALLKKQGNKQIAHTLQGLQRMGQQPQDSSGHPADGGMVDALSVLDIAFQPMVDIRVGMPISCEAFIRNTDILGFDTVESLIQHWANNGVLLAMELHYHRKAITKFASLYAGTEVALCLNLDGRSLLAGEEQIADNIRTTAEKCNIPTDLIHIDIAPTAPLTNHPQIHAIIAHMRSTCSKICLDSFGEGYDSLPLIQVMNADMVKIGRTFIGKLENHPDVRSMVRHIVDMAHVTGRRVVAKGIETEKEYYLCENLGFDMLQGYLVSPPDVQPIDLHAPSNIVQALQKKDKREKSTDQKLLFAEMDPLPPVRLSDSMNAVFDRFGEDKIHSFFPVVDMQGAPVGILRERDIKSLIYSPFGKDLYGKRILGRDMQHLISSAPVVHISTPAEKILEIFSASEAQEGLTIISKNTYQGFLTAHSLLRLLNEKNLAQARDQNPLTKLPGNRAIETHLNTLLATPTRAFSIAYYDFDNFKPFNDKYGYRQGDRAIMLFADLLHEHAACIGAFIGHVGGDDFVLIFDEHNTTQIHECCTTIADAFKNNVQSFYNAEDRRNGYCNMIDRDGNPRQMPIMGVSVGVLHVGARTAATTQDHLAEKVAHLKKLAKSSDQLVSESWPSATH